MALKTYEPIEESLAEQLPETADQKEVVREMIAFAESYGIVVSQHRREVIQRLESLTAKAILSLKKGEIVDEDDDGNVTVRIDKEAAERYQKLNADEKKALLAAEVSEVAAELEYVTNLELLIKRRCSFGQSLLNSFNIETQSSWNN